MTYDQRGRFAYRPDTLKTVFVACFTEALAFGLGTLSSTTGFIAILLIGVGVSLAMLLGAKPGWAQVGTFTAIFFAVGVGLPGGSTADAGERLVLSLLGGLWGFLGIGLRWSFASRRKSGVASSTKGTLVQTISKAASSANQSDAIKQAVTVGAASAVGLAVGLSLGLPRDFWIVVTIVLALRPSIPATINLSSMIVVGTLAGALIAAWITFEVLNDYLLWVFLLVFSVAFYATRGMNLGLSQVFMTPFIIVLLNILYRELVFAEVRILDVAIGGAIAVLTALILENRRLARLRKLIT